MQSTAEIEDVKYQVTGYRSGEVEIEDLRTQETISKLQLNPRVVRAIFPFSQEVIAISQLDRTTFFDLNERKPVHTLDQYLIGINEDKTFFLTYRKDQGSYVLSFYRTRPCRILRPEERHHDGVSQSQFLTGWQVYRAPIDSRCPFPDRYYPIDPVPGNAANHPASLLSSQPCHLQANRRILEGILHLSGPILGRRRLLRIGQPRNPSGGETLRSGQAIPSGKANLGNR
jgi:hypothetical protein